MPDAETVSPEQFQALQEQMAQLQRENSFLAEERNNLENLVMSGMPATRQPAPAPDTSKPAGSSSSSTPSVDELVSKVVSIVDKELVKPLKLETEKGKALDELVALRQNPKTQDVDLYVNEMRSVARQHPSLSMTQVYNLAKAETGPKKPLEPVETLRTSSIKPAAGADRFSGAEKVRSRSQVDDRRETSFVSSFDDAWDKTMAGKEV